MLRVDAQETAIPTERIQVIRGEGSDLNERSIETEGSMPFGEDEPVSVEIGWIANVEADTPSSAAIACSISAR